MLTHDEMVNKLRQVVKEQGSQYKAAQKLDISPQLLGDILAGNRKVSDKLARRLGLRREMVFVKDGQK